LFFQVTLRHLALVRQHAPSLFTVRKFVRSPTVQLSRVSFHFRLVKLESLCRIEKPGGTPKPCPFSSDPLCLAYPIRPQQIDVRSRREETLFVTFASPGRHKTSRLLLDDNGHQALGVLDVDGLDVAVELLLGILLVVSSSTDAHTDSVGNALDTLLPHLLVQLGVDADIRSLLL
jgi:hypothetical protein